MTAAPNTTIRVTCPYTGVPRPQVRWIREDGKSFSAVIYDNGTLVLPNNAASGRYTCTVINKDGEDSVSSQINVIGELCKV